MKLDFKEKHGKLYEKNEQAKVKRSILKTSMKEMANIFSKIEIPNQLSHNNLYDIMTPTSLMD